MKKLLLNCVLFISISIGVYLLLFSCLFFYEIGGTPLIYKFVDGIHLKGGPTYKSHKEFDPSGKYDILILGSSHAYRGYDPRRFINEGYKTFNLGSSAQTLMNSYHIAKNLIRADNCKMVILDVFEDSFINDGFESSSDLIENNSSDKAAIGMAISLADIRAINMITLRLLSKYSEPKKNENSYVGFGYCEKLDSVTHEVNYVKKQFIPNEKQFVYFEMLLNYLSSENISVVIVNHPQPTKINEVEHNRFIQYLKPYLEKYDFHFIDFSYKCNLDRKCHFYDKTHLNKAGVDIFNSELLTELKKRNILR